MSSPLRWPFKISLVTGAVAGGLYGTFFRLYAQLPHFGSPNAGMVMTLGFLAFGSFAIGYLTIALAWADRPHPALQWVVAPWIAIFLSCLIAWLMNLEGIICVVFALPMAMILSTIGGVCAGLVERLMSRKNRTLPMACVALVPLLIAPAENRFVHAPVQHRFVATEIRIHAPAEVVWKNIERVPPIAPSELKPDWTHAIGFPRPIEATLSYEGVGGVRHASFQRGLLFIETVTDWRPDRRLAFAIKADTKDIPPGTLDDHVTIGGRYFDVLNGAYEIEPLGHGDLMLHLYSEERLSTDFNGYAGLWSDAVMRNLQRSILQVIQKRCESAASNER